METALWEAAVAARQAEIRRGWRISFSPTDFVDSKGRP